MVVRSHPRILLILVAAILVASFLPAPPAARANGTFGFSQRGFNTFMLFIQSNVAYAYPDEDIEKFGEPQQTYTYLASKGHKYVRMGFSWDAAQRGITPTNTTAPLDAKYMAKVTNEITKAKKAGLQVVLVLGSPCRWADRTNDTQWNGPGVAPLICGKGLTDAHAANLWRQVSALYKSEPAVAVYDLFNEPTDFRHPTRTDMQNPADFVAPYSAYKSAVNASIKAIRDNGDSKYIWVESLCCTIYHDFASTDPNGPWVVDPLNRIEYSQHMYPDRNIDSAPRYNEEKKAASYSSDPGKWYSYRGYTTGFLNRLDNFGGWCATYNLKCSIGEVGWPGDLTDATDAPLWNELGGTFYNKANFYGLDVLYFGVASGLNGGITAYGYNRQMGWQFPAPGANTSYSQAGVIENPANLSK